MRFSADKIASELAARGWPVKRSGNRHRLTTTAICHGGDTKFGCWFADGKYGLVAGCYTAECRSRDAAAALKAAAGLQTAAAYQPWTTAQRTAAPTHPAAAQDLLPAPAGCLPSVGEVDDYARMAGIALSGPTRIYPYELADGRAVLCVVRYQTDAGKEPRRWSWNGRNWRPGGTANIRRVPLYHRRLLDAMPDAPALVCEGEKAAEAVRGEVVGVCALGGSNPHRGTVWQPLRGRRVAILPDADAAGDKFAVKVWRALSGLAGELTVLSPAAAYERHFGGDGNVPRGWDVADMDADKEAKR